MAAPARQLNANGRMVVLGVIAALLVASVLIARRASAPNFVPLQRGLTLEESGAVTEALGRSGVPFRLGAGGTEVLVPEADAARARVLLVQDGVPLGGRPGLELFDRPAWGMTDFTEQVAYRRALEGELARTISTLRGVRRAQVHLAIPASSALRRTDRPAEAAVVVALHADGGLSADQVRGIARLVSSSVDQLAPERVVVLDDSGRPLGGNAQEENGATLSAGQFDMQQGVESLLGARVQSLLAAAVGPSAVRVQVAARLNFDQVDRTIEAYDTSGRVLRSEQRSNVSAADPEIGGGSTVMVNEYLNSRTVERIIGGVGTVDRVTVSAMLDTRALGSTGELTEVDRERYAALIRDAIGYDEARGDRVTVLALPFNGVPAAPTIALPDTEGPAPGPGVMEVVSRLAFPVLSLLAVLVALVLGLRLLPKGGFSSSGRELPASPSADALAGHAPGDRGVPELDVAAEPQSAARVLRAWLTEPT